MLLMLLDKCEKTLFKDLYANELHIYFFSVGQTLIACTKESLRGNILNYVIKHEDKL